MFLKQINYNLIGFKNIEGETMSKSKNERQIKIRQILEEREKVKVVDLAKELDVTPETLRKDLNEMQERKILIKEHGYAKIQNSSVETFIELKARENKEMKKRVALEAFRRIENGMTVFLDSGSTILTALGALRNKSDITIVTNSILVAYECANMNLNIIMAGGLIFNIGKRTYGHFATEIIDHLNIDLAIMGTDAFTEKSHGFTTISADELGFKRHVINQSTQKIIISDSSKVNNNKDVAPYAFCRFNEFDELITNHLTPEQYDVVKTVKKVTQV